MLAEGTPEEVKARYGGAKGPEATMEDAFISLLESNQQRSAAA